MKGVLVVLGAIRGRDVAARVIDGRLEDLLIAPPEAAGPPPESLFRGTVGRPVKGLGGVFVDLPGGLSGFLRQVKGLRPGQNILVQVAGHAEPGKAVPLTQRILFKGRHAILTPDVPGQNISRSIKDAGLRAHLATLAEGALDGAPDSLGLILRSAANIAGDAGLVSEIESLRDLAGQILADTEGPAELLLDAPGPHEMALRDWALPAPDEVAEGAHCMADHGIDAMIDALLTPLVPLSNGASMAIEPTRALVAVDVNTGADMSPAAGLKANMAAARDLPRQLRLRGLGGQITVDFAPMPKRDRQVLEQCLQAAIRRDAGEISAAGWTPLGHYELQRKRDRAPLAACLA